MIKVPVNFRQTDEVLEFVKIVNEYPFHMDLVILQKMTVFKNSLFDIQKRT